MRLLRKADDASHDAGHDKNAAVHDQSGQSAAGHDQSAADAHAAGARDAADARSGKDLDLDAAATSRTGDDRDQDLSAPSPDAGPDSPVQLKGKGILGALKRTFKQFSQDNVTDWAAALTYYGVLSIFPGALVLVSILGMLSSDGQKTVQETVQQVAPSQQIQALVGQVLTQVQDPGTAGLAAIIGIAAAFWSASGYIGAFMRASNSIYDVPEGRPVWKTVPIRLGVTAVIGLMLIMSAFIVVFTGDLARVVGDKIGLGEAAVTTWNIAKWPVLVVIVSLMFAILYWASPNAKTGGFRWVSPGGIFAVLVWVAASAAFAVYLANFASYNKTYGTLGGVIAFLVWLWISNIAIMLGAELDAELERGRAIAAGHSPDDEPFLQLRDDRKLKKGSEKGLSTS
ncbi:YihY/virulence factor BrkB family protein [Actinoplanes sp. NPDC051346]|uniref:YihY/virulence factor BrkB family protein n=1 Tax=Actinoplanes sp. NPDC051346 TaxID=3155048 RepID=UPI003438A789